MGSLTRATTSSTAGTGDGIDRPRTDLPVVPYLWVERPRLLARLDVAAERALAMVIAPAGAGKTVTLAQWARTRETDDTGVRWLGSPNRLDVGSLGRELVSATRTLGQLDVPSGPITEQIAVVSDVLARLRARDIVIIDDAHRLPHSCYLLLDELLARCPHALHVVLLSRWDPPVPLAVLELQGNVSVLRGHQFQMTPAEARTLVALHAGAVRADAIDTVVRYAQGWPAVLVLAGKAMGEGTYTDTSVVGGLTENGLGPMDLLASQVFPTLTERQRHVLMCISAEDTVTPATAARLSGDPQSGELLEDLERVGLLVGREPQPRDDGRGEVHFRLHPLLLEVLRRRLAANGVEAMRARAVVVKAASMDYACGAVDIALRRMLWVGAFESATDVVARHGPDLVVNGHGDLVRRLAISAPELIAEHPGTWLTMTLERRRQRDHASVGRWSQKILDRALDGGTAVEEFDVVLACLLRSIGGAGDAEAAVDEAQHLVEERAGRLSYAQRALLLVQLGTAETWCGRLPAAAAHLRSAVGMCATAGFGDLWPDALSRLAIAELWHGRTLTAMEAATQALAMPRTASAEEYQHRASLVLELARQQTLPWAVQAPCAPAQSPTRPDDDLSTAVLQLMLSARAAAVHGVDGRTVLRSSPHLPVPPPRHVSVMLELERSAYAIRAGDVVDLRELAANLASLGATAESTCLRAVLAEIDADLGRAEDLLTRVVSGEHPCLYPQVMAHALVCMAQIADARGDRSRADTLMLESVRATAPDRYAVPFLGWSVRGTPVRVLLARLPEDEGSPWARELRQAFGHDDASGAGRVRVTSLSGRHIPDVPDAPATIPPLTRRESEVLFELAHGSSYADIAEALFITENTVKTHVSSLYAKLGVARRSQALRVSRSAGLL